MKAEKYPTGYWAHVLDETFKTVEVPGKSGRLLRDYTIATLQLSELNDEERTAEEVLKGIDKIRFKLVDDINHMFSVFEEALKPKSVESDKEEPPY